MRIRSETTVNLNKSCRKGGREGDGCSVAVLQCCSVAVLQCCSVAVLQCCIRQPEAAAAKVGSIPKAVLEPVTVGTRRRVPQTADPGSFCLFKKYFELKYFREVKRGYFTVGRGC